MIKVMFLIDSLGTGGAENSVVDMGLNFKNIIPIFVHIYKNDQLKKKLTKRNIEVYSLNVPEGYNYNLALKRLEPLIVSIKPDILHSTLFNSDIIGRKIKKKFPLLLINSFVNNSYSRDRYKKLSLINKAKLYFFQQYDKFTSSNVDLFISNSAAIKVTNASALKVPSDKITVIHRGRDRCKYENISILKLNRLRLELNISNETIFLNVGRLLERKGQMDLLVAFRELLKTSGDMKLLIAGEGGYKTALQDFIANNKLEGKVHLLGNRKDIPELLNLAHFFVFPSWFEGLPGALIEAMMAGTPVIMSDIPENLECVTQENALIFRKGDPMDLAEKIRWAVDNRTVMIKKGDQARTLARNKFEINQIVKEYEKTYSDLLRHRSEK